MPSTATVGWPRLIALTKARRSLGETSTDPDLYTISIRFRDNAGDERTSLLARKAVMVVKGIVHRNVRHRIVKVSLLITYDVLSQFAITNAAGKATTPANHHLPASAEMMAAPLLSAIATTNAPPMNASTSDTKRCSSLAMVSPAN